MEFTLAFIKLFFLSIYVVSPLLIFLTVVIIILGQIVCWLEKWRKFDALYWSFITATTVGYGDIRPLRKRSKVISIFIALVGMMFTGIIIAVTLNTVDITLKTHLNKNEVIMEKIKKEFNEIIR